MPSVRIPITLAANETNANALSGSPFEFVGAASQVEVAVTRVGAAGSNILADVTFGPQVQIEGAQVPVERSTGSGPLLPDNVIVSDIAAPGDRLRVALRETDGVGDDAVVFVRVEPV